MQTILLLLEGCNRMTAPCLQLLLELRALFFEAEECHHKKQSSYNPSRYRSLNHTLVISRLFERLTEEQMTFHPLSRSPINDGHHGFLKSDVALHPNSTFSLWLLTPQIKKNRLPFFMTQRKYLIGFRRCIFLNSLLMGSLLNCMSGLPTT